MAYSYIPLRIISLTGILTSFAGIIYAIIIFVLKILGKISIYGWAPMMMLILFLSGIQMLMLGVIGEYLWRTLDQVRERKQFIIKEIID